MIMRSDMWTAERNGAIPYSDFITRGTFLSDESEKGTGFNAFQSGEDYVSY